MLVPTSPKESDRGWPRSIVRRPETPRRAASAVGTRSRRAASGMHGSCSVAMRLRLPLGEAQPVIQLLIDSFVLIPRLFGLPDQIRRGPQGRSVRQQAHWELRLGRERHLQLLDHCRVQPLAPEGAPVGFPAGRQLKFAVLFRGALVESEKRDRP